MELGAEGVEIQVDRESGMIDFVVPYRFRQLATGALAILRQNEFGIARHHCDRDCERGP